MGALLVLRLFMGIAKMTASRALVFVPLVTSFFLTHKMVAVFVLRLLNRPFWRYSNKVWFRAMQLSRYRLGLSALLDMVGAIREDHFLTLGTIRDSVLKRHLVTFQNGCPVPFISFLLLSNHCVTITSRSTWFGGKLAFVSLIHFISL